MGAAHFDVFTGKIIPRFYNLFNSSSTFCLRIYGTVVVPRTLIASPV